MINRAPVDLATIRQLAAEVDTTALCDVADDIRIMSSALRCRSANPVLCGPAVTVRCRDEMNGHGGTLLVGVQNDGSVLGLEEDLTVFSKKNTDGWELWLTELLILVFGKAVAANVTVAFGIIDERTVARIDVAPASAPVYTTRTKTGAKGSVFLVRLNNTTHELDGPDASKYQHDRWFK